MKRERLKALPLYPEKRRRARPSRCCGCSATRSGAHPAELFTLCKASRPTSLFTPLQTRVLDLLGVPASAFRGRRASGNSPKSRPQCEESSTSRVGAQASASHPSARLSKWGNADTVPETRGIGSCLPGFTESYWYAVP